MRDKIDNEELLVRYLLGDLPEQEQVRLEEEFFTNDECYQQLLALEDELIYDYAQGRLQGREREKFEKRFLATAEDRKRLEHARVVLSRVERSRGLAIAGRGSRSWRESLIAFLNLQNPTLRYSFAAISLLVMAGFVWLMVETARLKDRIDRLQSERAAREDQLREQSDEERANRDRLNRELERERSQRAQLEQELARQQEARDQRAMPAILSFVLSPGLTRDDAGGIKRLTIPRSANVVQLQLRAKKGEYKSYRAELLTADGDQVWSRGDLRPRGTGEDRAVILRLPVRLLAEDDYEIALKGVTPGGELEDVGYYRFNVMKR